MTYLKSAINKKDDLNFLIGDSIVYPTHGVGTIVAEENQEVAGISVPVYVISFLSKSDKTILRIPKNRANKVGLRHLATKEELLLAMNIIQDGRIHKQKAKLMWSKRSREYESKINSGSPVLLAEVISSLYKNDDEERSYSEKQIYDTAMQRFAQEYSVIFDVTKEKAVDMILAALKYRV